VSEDDTRYRMRPRERIAVAMRKAPGPTPDAAPADFPAGSDPEIPVIPPLAVPTAGATRIRFGDTAVVVERKGDRVTLVFPGGVRVEGTAAEAASLAAALSVRPPPR
jgi:hypothetical protein